MPSTIVHEEELRVLDSQFLNPTAAMLEHLLASLARCESRLDERDRRTASNRPPPRLEPDPPDRSLPHNRPWSTAVLGPQPNPTMDSIVLHGDPTTGNTNHIGTDPYTPQSLSSLDQYGQPACVTCQPNTLQQSPPSFHPYETPQMRQPSCWEQPVQRQPWGIPTYDQPPPQYLQPPFSYKSASPYTQLSSADQQSYAWQQRLSPSPNTRWCPQGPIQMLPTAQPRQPTSWDLSDQHQHQGYLPIDCPSYRDRPISLGRFENENRCWEVEEERCYVGKFTYTHSPKFEESLDIYGCGCAHELRIQNEDFPYSSSSVAPTGYSSYSARDFYYLSKHKMVEEENCAIPERGVSTDSILETEATKIIDREATYSQTGNVSSQAIVGTSDIRGKEGKLLDDGSPPPSPILQLSIPEVSEEEETLFKDKENDGSIGEVKEIIASIHVARVPSQDVENCWNKRGGAYTSSKILIHGNLFVGDVTGSVHRSTFLDADARLVPPRHDVFRVSSSWFQVPKVAGDFLMTKYMELKHLKHKYGLFSSKKSSGSYKPYSNVDFFLKVCKKLGLNGGDLFSSSDVVEKRKLNILSKLGYGHQVFDPGGDISKLMLSLALLIASWFPP